ncbi:hypothetical protein HC891_02545 [Candidatus Gracilibacteria bacterium]|nr:hypothetical protein [Candidatus Gracilibacteria bacterium]
MSGMAMIYASPQQLPVRRVPRSSTGAGRKSYVFPISAQRFIRRSGLFLLVLLTVSLLAAPRGNAQDGQTKTYLPVLVSGGSNDGGPTAIVFVSRQIPAEGTIYWDEAKGLPGVGPYSRYQVASPGKLLVREANGSIRTLVDGSKPTAASLNLIDVNAPDVSYDGKTIVFAGLPKGDYNRGPHDNADAWRIYAIGANGAGLKQLTFDDQDLNLQQFAEAANGLSGYDDSDPAWLPDGRIVFSSTRWPSYAQYSGVRATNLHVMNADGSKMRRITAERNGADRPLVDPITGKIVFARWWRNYRFATNSMETVADPNGGYRQHNGLTADRADQLGGNDFLWRNAWQAAAINPDGTDLAMWGGALRNEEGNHVYGGAFLPDGSFIANYFPMFNMSEAAGFGGLRHYQRGAGTYESIIGITDLLGEYAHNDPPSFGVYKGDYVTDPEPLPDGRLLISWADDAKQDYGLYTINPDGSDRRLLYDNPTTTEVRARVIRVRAKPPIIRDTVTSTPSLLPPPADGPYDQDGTFVFDALNVYFNAPVDTDIVNAPPVGSAQNIRFFIDHQRSGPGSFPNLDWPIQINTLPISPQGAVRDTTAPANVPLFEQIRSGDNKVPFTGSQDDPDGAAHVAGMNYGRPGTTVSCVGCHAGHTMIDIPTNRADAQWTNLATGATVTVSSSRDAKYNGGLIDRRVMKGEIWRYWNSNPGKQDGEWVQLTFPVPVSVRVVRLYNPRKGDEANSSIQVERATIVLFSDAAAKQEVARKTVNRVAVTGTDANFDEITVRSIRINLDDVSGTFYGMTLASLAEIEVIARGEGAQRPRPVPLLWRWPRALLLSPIEGVGVGTV